jgi:NADPH-dependent 2,4-dienoyl-CoA reductase/sulfur reductase-like enzyme
MARRVIVVGGDAAGMSAASQVRRANPALDVVVLERGAYASYGACGIPYYVGGEIDGAQSLLALTPEDIARRGIDLRTGHEVLAVRPGGRTVEVRTADGARRSERYDYLVLATGSLPRTPDWADTQLGNVFSIRGLEDGIALSQYVTTKQPRSAVVVGAGFIGFEMAEALLKRGLQVTLVGRSQALLSGFDAEFLAPALRALERGGLALVRGEPVKALHSSAGRVAALELAERSLPADLLVLATGVAPAASLAREAGIATGEYGGILVDDRMKTGTPGVYAAGDCVEVTHVVTGGRVAAPLALTANRTGRVAGDNLAAESLGRQSQQRFRGTAATSITKIADFAVAQTGVTARQAEDAGFTAAVFERSSSSRAAYYPGGTPLQTRIVVDRRTSRLLGAQMLGQEGVAGRIDVFATALFNRMTVQQIYDLDLAYAPPFGPVYDPVIDICGRAAVALGVV